MQQLKEWSDGGRGQQASKQQGKICGEMEEKRGRAAGNTTGLQEDLRRMWKNKATLLKEIQG